MTIRLITQHFFPSLSQFEMLTIKWIQYTLEIHQSLCCLDNQSIFRNVTSTWSSIALLLKHSFVAWEFNLLFVAPGAYLSYAFLFGLSGKLLHWLVEGRFLSCRVCGRGLGEGLAATSHLGTGCAGCSFVHVVWLLICSARGMCEVVVPDVCPGRSSSANGAGEPWAVCLNTLSQISCSQGSVALWYRRTVPCCRHWQTVMALLLPLSYPSFGCNWKQLSAMEAVAGTVSLYSFFVLSLIWWGRVSLILTKYYY